MDEQKIFERALTKKNAHDRSAWLDAACGEDLAARNRIMERLLQRDQASASSSGEGRTLDERALASATEPCDPSDAAPTGCVETYVFDTPLNCEDKTPSVLKMISNTIGDVPHLVLGDPTVEENDPINRPNSPEIPATQPDRRYRLDGEIARGGMGAIIKGRDTDLGRDLAIKVLLDSHKDNPQVIQRFVEEAQIGGQLQHPGIAPIYELGQLADQRPFFSMKLVKGETLSSLLAERETPAKDRGRFIGIFEQICQTMAYAHSREVIHRDLKPANVMVGAFGEVQVMDWGLAKVLPRGGVADEQRAHQKQQVHSVIETRRSAGSDAPGIFGSGSAETQMGSVMGTPAYMPPEQALGEIDQLDQRADVFGLGAILCEILTGKPPYVAENGSKVFRMASRGKLQECFARLDASEADSELLELTRQCLAVEPADRPKDASVVTQRVTNYLEAVETKLRQAEVQAATEAAQAIEERKRRRVTTVLAGVVSMLLVLGGVVANYAVKQRTAKEAIRTEQVNQVNALLREIAIRQREHKWQIAKIHLRQAERIAAGVNDPVLIRKTTNARTDLEMSEAIHDYPVQLWRSHALGHYRDFKSQNGQLANLLKQYLLERFQIAGGPFRLTTEEISVVATSPIRAELIALLDSWSTGLPQHRSLMQKDLLTLATKLDDSHVANRIRLAVIARDEEKLVRIADSLDPTTLPPLLLKLLGESINAEKQSNRLLAQSTLLYPDVFFNWIRAGEGRGRQLEFFRGAVVAYPNVPELWAEFAVRLHAEGFIEESDATLKTAALRFPKSGTIRYHLALKSFKSGMLHEAGRLGMQAVELEPNYYRPHLLNAELAESRRDLIAAENSLRRAVLCCDANQEPLDRYIDFIERHEGEEEVGVLPKWLEGEEVSSMTMHLCGRALRSKGYIPSAIKAYRRALELNPQDRWALNGLGEALQFQGDLDEAIKVYQKSLQIEPRGAYANRKLGDVLRAKGRLQDAVAAYQKTITIEPTYKPAYFELAETLNDQDKLTESLVVYQNAAELFPDYAYAHIRLADALEERKQLDESIHAYRKAIKINPENGITHCRLGSMLVAQDRIDEAVAAFSTAVELDPESPSTLNAAAWGLAGRPNKYLRPEHIKNALGWAEKGSQLKPDDLAIADTLGVIQYRNRECEKAIDTLQKAGALEEPQPHQWLVIAMCHHHLGDNTAASKWFDKANAWQADHEPSSEQLLFFSEASALLQLSSSGSARANETVNAETTLDRQ